MLGFGWKIPVIWKYLSAPSGPVEIPIAAPTAMTYAEATNGVTFGWTPPATFGTGGPHSTNRYEYSVRVRQTGQPWRAWTNPRRINVTAWTINWELPQNEQLQFRVRARDGSTPTKTSDWLTSVVLTEGEPLPGAPTGPFASEFGKAFDGGG